MSEVHDYSYLLERQSNAERLKRKAFEDFASARNSGRLVAFVGSYASAHFGYPDWKGMVQEFLETNGKKAKSEQAKSLVQVLKRYSSEAKFPDVDLMDLSELMAGIDRLANAKGYSNSREDFAGGFHLLDVTDLGQLPNAGDALLKDLGITRFMTLNYDFELEWQVFLTDHERESFATMQSLPDKKTREQFFVDRVIRSESVAGRLERAIPGRGRVTSDILSREDCAQLIEFALASPELQCRILHAHGRADDPLNLLVTRRDYRDRYWRTGFSKLPFEYGLRLIFAGNPILFVGLGASEDDVMRVLEQFLSDNPNRRVVPMFMIWNSEDDATDDARRLLFNRKFGIHILFDREIAAFAGTGEDYLAKCGAFGKNQKKAKAFRLIEPLRHLASFAETTRQHGFWHAGDFRSAQWKYDPILAKKTTEWRKQDPEDSYRVDIWRHVRTEPAACGPIHATRRKLLGDIEAPTESEPEAPGLVEALAGGAPIKAIIGESAIGRGAIADSIGASYEEALADSENGRVVVVNGAFATDTDSIFGILSGAFNQLTAQAQGVSRAAATREMFELKPRPASVDNDPSDDADAPDGEPPRPLALRPGPLTIIINGMERFIAHDGSALSNELDMLVRLVIEAYRRYERDLGTLADTADGQPAADGASAHTDSRAPSATGSAVAPPSFPLRLILIGTQRLLRYLEVAAAGAYDQLQLERRKGHTVLPIGAIDYWRECRPFFDIVAAAINGTGAESGRPEEIIPRLPLHHEKASRRREFFRRVFDHAFPAQRGVRRPELAFELLRTLAYIGQPTEKHVLYHAPSLVTEGTPHDQRPNIDSCIDQLKALGLILPIKSFPNGKSERLGLHKTVIAEIRERYGVPMSDSRLANGFNLSLFTAQSTDSYTPDQRWHDQIGKLADYLIGPSKNGFSTPSSIQKAAAELVAQDRSDPEIATVLDESITNEVIAMLASPEKADCLRAALSLLRSYYSIPALLMHSNRDLDPWLRDGPLSEHAERLTRLISVARQVVAARRIVGSKLGNPADMGPAPFYPDDLMWLNNELGVVRLTQGNLYEARRKLSEASRINRLFVEHGERLQNWRRIELNQLQVDIERGRIERAEDRIRDIEFVVEEQARLFTANDAGSAREYIIDRYARDRSFAGDGRPARIDPLFPTDLVLTIAITQGYRGLCQHLRGSLDASLESFQGALRILRHLDEQRAYAFFLRHLASLQVSRGDVTAAQASLRLSVAAAGHGLQTDIDHAGRISMVQYSIGFDSPEVEKSRKPIPQLTETLRYSTNSDMYRLQIEAMQTLAAVHLQNGDADSALRFATDALAIATRCGFGLRKVSLRILLGRVMAFRNDLSAARALLESASLIATKLHYERAVEAAEDERVRIG